MGGREELGQAVVEPEKPRPQDTSVFVDRTDEVRTEEHLGYLWPIAVYKPETGDKPSRKQLTTVEHAGNVFMILPCTMSAPAQEAGLMVQQLA